MGKIRKESQILSKEKEERQKRLMVDGREREGDLGKNVDFEEVKASFVVGREGGKGCCGKESKARVDFRFREPHTCLGMDGFERTSAGVKKGIKKSDARLAENLRKLKLAVPRELRPDQDPPLGGSRRSIDRITGQTRARS